MTTHIILTTQQYIELTRKIQTGKLNTVFACIPIYENEWHPAKSSILMVGVLIDDQLYVVNKSHPDLPAFDIDIFIEQCSIIHNKNAALYSHYTRALDLESYFYTESIPVVQEPYEFDTYGRFTKNKNINRIRPATHLIHKIRTIASTVPAPSLSKAWAFYSDIVIPSLHFIEKNGLQTTTGLVYSKYNIFNTTGRVSNSYHGINYLALNKTDESREMFVSRFENGKLIQFDFDAYHLRLLANYLGLPIPKTSIHLELAKEYYKTDDITDELYESSKKKTFAILYGTGIPHDAPTLLVKIKTFEQELWKFYLQNFFILAPFSNRHIVVDQPSPSKVFNYFVQCLEFETTIQRLYNLSVRLSDFVSIPILYTYDSVLFDCLESESERLVAIVKEVLEDSEAPNGYFPVDVSIGQNYKDLYPI